MARTRTHTAFSLVEVMIMAVLLGIVMTAGGMVFVCGQDLFALTSAQSDLQANVMHALHRISFELEDSGTDSAGTFRVSILDNAGTSGTDILRFAVPLCVCGKSPIDASGNVSNWGAPLIWGQNNCDTSIASYPVGQNGKVDVCHYPPGNINNPNTLNVSINAIAAHLAHGDYIGDCNACNPSGYTNRTIEYLVDASGNLLRHVLDANNAVLRTATIARNVTGFQTVASGDHSTVNVTVQATGKTSRGRLLVFSYSVDVLLRNR